MDQLHAAGELGQEGGLLHRRIAATDDRDVLVLEEEAVARGTRRDSPAQQLLLTGDLEVAGSGTHREDDRIGAMRLAAGVDLFDRAGQADCLDVFHAEIGAEPDGLLTHLVHECGALDAVLEAGVVLDLGRGHERTTELRSLEDDRCQFGAGCVYGSGVSGRSGPDDDQVVDLLVVCLAHPSSVLVATRGTAILRCALSARSTQA